MEHHSNIVPWQIISEKTGAIIQYIKSTPNGTLNLEDFENMLNENVKIVSVTHASNVFGTINPIKKLLKKHMNRCVSDGRRLSKHSTYPNRCCRIRL
ncbi:MAG: hypothetical protein Ct9H90mP15_03510 [Candidatus Neomarinimicrobiota bacterium]|nr:MAG: hypothetical protein Ct9H90mP15_03510 [Candidatus Neomarinimicrobiota bacterium]